MPAKTYTRSVGEAAMMAAAISTLYFFTPVEVLTRLLSATVTGWESPPLKTTPNRKSFHIWVVCQMTVTTMMGADTGRMIRQKIRKNPAPSIRAALIRSSGMET